MMRGDESEARRILARYRRLVLLGAVRLPLEEARRLVGPDCAYHLYFRHGSVAGARAVSSGARARRTRPAAAR